MTRVRALLALALLGGCSTHAGVAAPSSAAAPAAQQVRRPDLSALRFEANRGQFPREVRFLARSRAGGIAFTDDGAQLRLGHGATRANLRIGLVGSRPRTPVGDGPLATHTNYLVGARSQWASDVPNFARVHYAGVLPGVDLHIHGNDGRVEYDIEAAPGLDPATLQMRFDGATALRIDDRGALRIATAGGELTQPAPVVYDEDRAGVHHPLVASYVVHGRDRVGFAVRGHDAQRKLVIDPVVIYSSFLGGDGDERVNRIAVDGSGNLFLVGYTESSNFPHPGGYDGASSGAGDAFVAKITAAGSTLEWATYVGGSQYDEALGLWIDGGGKIWFTGTTASTDFPVVSPFQATAVINYPTQGPSVGFAARLSANGSTLEYGTFFGDAYQCCGGVQVIVRDVFVNGSGQMYITGTTGLAWYSYTTIPVVSGYQDSAPVPNSGTIDGFVTRVAANGTTLVSSTFLGGTGDDYPQRMRVDASGNIFIAGYTNSSDYPTLSPPSTTGSLGGWDNFYTVLNPSGTALVRSARVGGSSNDLANDVFLASSGAVYWAGSTTSTDYPIVGGIQATRRDTVMGKTEGYLTMLNPAGTALAFSTYYGGIDNDAFTSISVNPLGEVYAGGTTSSSDLNLLNPLPTFGDQLQGGTDGYVVKVSSDGSTMLSSTYFGSAGNDDLTRLTTDGSGVYIAGTTNGIDLPTVGPFQASYGGGNSDVFAAKLVNNALITPVGASVARSQSVTFTASNGSGNYTWSMQAAPSGGTINSGGVYTAGTTGGVTDVVKLVDNGNGAISTAGVTVYQCSDDNDCSATQYCSSVYTCQARRPGSSGCNPAIDCADPAHCTMCAAPNICSMGTCKVAACANDAACPTGSYCGADSNCHSKKQGGSACNTAAGQDCKVTGCAVCTATCASGTCNCAGDTDCPSGRYCATGGVCTLQASPGGGCTPSSCAVSGCNQCGGGTTCQSNVCSTGGGGGGDMAVGGGGQPDLAAPMASKAPVLDGAFNATANVGKAYAFNSTNQLTLSGDVAAQKPVTFGKDSGPDNFFVDQATGSISWVPRNDQQGPQTIVVHAANAVESTPFSFMVTVGATSFPPPSAQLTADRVLGKAPLQVAFSASSTPGIGASLVGSTIDLADGSSLHQMTSSSVSYTYKLVGSFRPELRVTQSDGQSSLSKTTIVVQDLNGVTPPQVHATATVSSSDPKTLTFDGDFTPGSQPIVGYAWDFGDGERTGELKPTHSFAKSGSYLVTVQAYDDLGYYGADKVLVLLNVSGTNIAPSVRLAADPPTGDVGTDGLQVTFTATAENLDAQVTGYAWDFGDGVVMNTTDGQIDHVFGSPGVYVARVTMTTMSGFNATSQVNVAATVSGGHLPPTIVSFGARTGKVGVPYVYSESGFAAARGDRQQFEWSMGTGSADGADIDARTGKVSWTPTTAGSQRLVLRAANAFGAATAVVQVDVSGGKGCGCTLAPTPLPGGPLLLVAIAVLAVSARRRRSAASRRRGRGTAS